MDDETNPVVREYLDCPFCPYVEHVSAEDPDSSLSELDRHMRSRHPDEDVDPFLWSKIEVRCGR